MKRLKCAWLLLSLLLRCSTAANVADNNVTSNAEDAADVPKGDETWKSVQNLLRQVVDEVIKRALPSVMSGRSQVNISGECTASLMQFVFDLRQMKLWALQMVDAIGKPTPGILKGSLALLGSYEQCLDIELRKSRRKFKGQYCTVKFMPILPPKPKYIPLWNHSLLEDQPESSKIPLSDRLSTLNQYFYIYEGKLGICLPSSCNSNEVEQIANTLFQSFNLRGQVERCEVKEKLQITKQQIIAICFLGIFLLLVTLATVLDCLDYDREQIPKKNKGKIRDILTCFSAKRSLRTLFGDPSIGNFSCLHGIHVITIAWLIVGLTYRYYKPQYMQKILNLETDSSAIFFQFVQSSRTGFNTIYFLGGLLTAYFAIKSCEEKKFNYIMFIMQRYLRLTVLVLTSLCFIVISPLFGSGPLWYDLIEKNTEVCVNYWWTYFLYVSNWMKHENMCTYAFQYASTIFQLHVISLFIIISLKWTKFGLIVILALIATSIAFIAYFTFSQEVFITATKLYESQFQKILFEYVSLQTYTHLGPYCAGICTGYLLIRYNDIKIEKLYQVIGWIVAAFLCLVVLFYPYVSHHRDEPNKIESTFTSSLHRMLWSVTLAWICFICIVNPTGFISKILSFRMFIPLSRISHLSLFLVEYVIQIRYGLMQSAFVYSKFNMMYEIFGHSLMLIVIASIGYILIEAPISALQYKIFSNYSRKTAEIKDDIKFQPQSVQLKAVLTYDRHM